MKKQSGKWTALGRRSLAFLLMAVLVLGFGTPVYAVDEAADLTEKPVQETAPDASAPVEEPDDEDKTSAVANVLNKVSGLVKIPAQEISDSVEVVEEAEGKEEPSDEEAPVRQIFGAVEAPAPETVAELAEIKLPIVAMDAAFGEESATAEIVETVKVVNGKEETWYTLETPAVVGDMIYLKWDWLLKQAGLEDPQHPVDLWGVWSAAAGTDIVEIESYRDKDLDGSAGTLFDKTYRYFFVKIKALKEGTATLHFTFREGKDIENGRTTLKIEIPVVGSAFWIRDEIATTGCLVPVTTRTDIVSYAWSKKIGAVAGTIDPDALGDTYVVENGVNVALDKGGIDEADKLIKTYTVKGFDANGDEVASADFQVKYGNEVLNGSFENTDVNYGTEGKDKSIYAQLPNGYPDLYWQTTGTGALRKDQTGAVVGDYLGHDIEIFHDRFVGVTDAYVAAVEAGNIPALGLCHSYDGYREVVSEDPALNGMNETYAITEPGNKVVNYAVPNRNTVPAGYGHQAAELNCEEYGALYQDVITTPGAELYWQVYHTARFDDKYGLATKDGKVVLDGNNKPTYVGGFVNHSVLQNDGTRRDHDHMCVIIMPTEHARKIITKTDVDHLLASVMHEGKEYKYYNATGGTGGFYLATDTAHTGEVKTELKGARANIDGEWVTFDIVECKATNDGWTFNEGKYQVPAGQYLTRFFFVATISVADNLAGGNFIDGITFGERWPYQVEYYVQDEYGSEGFSKVEELSERALTSEATASATKTGSSLLGDYSLSYTTVNGKTTADKATTFRTTPPQDGSTPTLRLYYVKKGVAMTKNVEITNHTLLPDTPVELLQNYSVTVNLYDNAGCVGDPVATATIPFSAVTDTNQFSGVYEHGQTAMFKKDGRDFAPAANTTYYAKEAAPDIPNYTNDGLDKEIAITTDDKGIATASITNKYRKIETSAIGIEKQVTGNMGDRSENFAFTIRLRNDGKEPAEYISFPDEFCVPGVTVAADKMSATFTLKHADVIELTEIPVGVVLEITEDCGAYSVQAAQGRQQLAVMEAGFGEKKTVMMGTEILIGANGKVTVTNDKTAVIDSGVMLDSVPYILLLTGAVAVGGYLLLRKRKTREE